MRDINKLPFFNLFARRRKSRGTMWVSLIVLGISAAVYGIKKVNQRDTPLPYQNLLKRFAPNTDVSGMSAAALTEFSEELLDSALKNPPNQ